MKSKKILKKWVQGLLGIIMLIVMMIGTADCEITKVFIIKGLICTAVILVCFVIFKNYTKLFDESEGE